MTQTVTNQLLDYTSIPEHPKTLTEVAVYSDPELSDFSGFLPSETPLEITTLILNQQMLPVFELSDGTYLPASQQFVIDDTVLAEVPFEADFWLEKRLRCLSRTLLYGSSAFAHKTSNLH